MPRTKRVTKRATDIKPDKNLLDQEIVQAWSNGIDRKVLQMQEVLKTKEQSIHLNFKMQLEEKFMKFQKYFNIPLNELNTLDLEEQSINSDSSRKARNTTLQRSTVKKRSMSQSTVNRSKRVLRKSKSLTRTATVPKAQRYATPAGLRIPCTTLGMITPKVKPNAPQVILRRPLQGEVAVSMQGSPLMVGPVIGDQNPNINIPLLDGRVFSVQPEKGLRISELPDFDEYTRKQIETLRDNLNKICSISKQ